MSGQLPRKTRIQAFFFWIARKILPLSARRWISACLELAPPSVVGLSESDKEKAEYEHGMKLREISLDKGCFAVILAGLGAIGIYCGNKKLDDRRAESAQEAETIRQTNARQLEEFRTKEASRRTLVEKQIPELVQINSAMSEVTRVYFPHARGKKPADEQQVKKEYEAALEKAREVINRSPFLFDLDFNKDLDRYFKIHRQMSRLPIEKWTMYRKFAAHLSNKFDDLCRSVIANKRDDPKTRERMNLDDKTLCEADKTDDPEKYINAFYNAWDAKRKASK
jgi:hypothetical protein